MLPVEPHELDTHILWQLVNGRLLVPDHVAAKYLRILLQLAGHADANTLVHTANWVAVVVDFASKLEHLLVVLTHFFSHLRVGQLGLHLKFKQVTNDVGAS